MRIERDSFIANKNICEIMSTSKFNNADATSLSGGVLYVSSLIQKSL